MTGLRLTDVQNRPTGVLEKTHDNLKLSRIPTYETIPHLSTRKPFQKSSINPSGIILSNSEITTLILDSNGVSKINLDGSLKRSFF